MAAQAHPLNMVTDIEPKPPEQAGPTSQKISFAAKLAKPKLKQRFQSIPLPNRQYGYLEGKPRISFTSAEIDAGAKAYQYSLIAKFTIGRPSIDVIRQTFQANWDIKGRATLSEIWDGRHLMIILDSEEDMITAMTCPLRKVQHAMFRLFRYSTDYNPRHESTIAVKWLRLPGLPPPLFHRNYIGAIVNSFADFLDVDDRTKACATMRYARACAEIDVTHPIPSKVWIDLPEGKSYWQEIVLEGNLAYCSHCRIHGHDLSQCRKKKPAAQHNAQEKTVTQTPKHQQETEWKLVTHKKNNTDRPLHTEYGPDNLYKVTKESNIKAPVSVLETSTATDPAIVCPPSVTDVATSGFEESAQMIPEHQKDNQMDKVPENTARSPSQTPQDVPNVNTKKVSNKVENPQARVDTNAKGGDPAEGKKQALRGILKYPKTSQLIKPTDNIPQEDPKSITQPKVSQ